MFGGLHVRKGHACAFVRSKQGRVAVVVQVNNASEQVFTTPVLMPHLPLLHHKVDDGT